MNKEQYAKANPNAVTALRMLERYEGIYGKPGVNFSKEEILTMYREANRGVKMLNAFNTALRKYMQETAGTPAAYGQINYADLHTCAKAKKQILTREDVDAIECILLNATDRALIELAWEGVSSWDTATQIKRSSVTPGKTLLLADGRELPLTDKLHRYLMDAFAESSYNVYSDPPKAWPLVLGDGLYKPKASAKNPDSDWARKKWHTQILRTVAEYAGAYHLPSEFTAIDLRNFGIYAKMEQIMMRTGYDLLDAVCSSEEGKNVLRRYGLPTAYQGRYNLYLRLINDYDYG